MAKYNDAQRASVLASLMEGQSVNKVAKEYDIPKSTVSRWKNSDYPINGIQKKEIGELLLRYLETNLETLQVQAKTFQDERWLLKQNAADLAVLHGVMTDKAIRLIEAMNNANAGAN